MDTNDDRLEINLLSETAPTWPNINNMIPHVPTDFDDS